MIHVSPLARQVPGSRSALAWALGAVLITTNPRAGIAQTLQLNRVTAERATVQPNLVANPSFEQADNGIPAGWQWDRRNTDATCTLDTTVAHSGGQSLHLTNGTPFGANVYGTLWRAPVHLTAGQLYTVSVYVKSEHPGVSWIGGGHDWQVRMVLPATGGQWQRVWKTFTPGPDDVDFSLRINTDAPTSGVWLDDIKLEAGAAPTLFDAENQAAVTVEAVQPEMEVEDDGAFTVPFALALPHALPQANVEASALGVQLGLWQALPLASAGAWRLNVTGIATGLTTQPRTVQLRLLDGANPGKVVATAQATVRFFSASSARTRLDALRQQLPTLKRRLDTITAQGQDAAYPLVTYTVLDNFANFVDADINARPPQVRRALNQLDALEAMATRLNRELTAPGAHFGVVPRWTGTQRPDVVGPSFIAPTTQGRRPVFFTGYGAFGQVRQDIEKFPGYGANIIQIETGPNAVFPNGGTVSDAPMRELRGILDRASRAGVAVNLLISPHYFPAWMKAKDPALIKKREGFLQFSLYEKSGQELLHRYVTTLMAPLKDHPALHSICLSNEPVNLEESGPAQAAAWHDWLGRRHGDITTLNARWHANYAKFADVPLPDPFKPPPPGPLWMDWVHFNEDFFANWHAMLAAAVHAVAPNLPVHAKAMTWTFTSTGDVRFGVDAFLFSRFSQINGNDSANGYGFGQDEWAQNWIGNALSHDLQQSCKMAPVFNSENHIINDRETRDVPPEHIRAALWQAAIHGQSATTIWVWERSNDPNSDTAGSILHRPLCVEAAGVVGHDLNRAALEVSALQQAPPQAAILQSPTAAVWDNGAYNDCLNKLYTALSFTGLKIGFAPERGLEAGQLPPAPLLFIPNVTHLSDAAFATLQRYQGRIVFVGSDALLAADEYGTPRPQHVAATTLAFRYAATTWRDLWQALPPLLSTAHVTPAVTLVDDKAQPAWGVEWRAAPTATGTVVNLCNYRNEMVRVSLRRAQQPVVATDVLSGERLPANVALRPLEVRLLRLQDK